MHQHTGDPSRMHSLTSGWLAQNCTKSCKQGQGQEQGRGRGRGQGARKHTMI